MKKIGCFALLLSLLLVLCSCGSASPSESTDVPNAPSSSASANAASDAISVDSGVFDVTLKIPKDYAGEEMTQEKCDSIASENGYKSVTLNDDGSVTYVVSKAQHKKMMEALKESIDDGINKMIESENFPNITAIDANDDYTEFTVSINGDSVGITESFSTLAFYMYGGMYNSFNGSEADNISVKFINSASGALMQEANSKDAG